VKVKKLAVAAAAATSLLSVAAFAGLTTPASAQTHITLEVNQLGGVSFVSRVCSSGLSNLGLGQGYVFIADNGCNGRLWLHRLVNGGGASYCINPNTDEEIPAADQATISITASANTARCLS
jgi:hypothetical protein